jgi:hypothetical protein
MTEAVVSLTVETDRSDAVTMTIDALHWAMAKIAEAGIAANLSVRFTDGDEPPVE